MRQPKYDHRHQSLRNVLKIVDAIEFSDLLLDEFCQGSVKQERQTTRGFFWMSRSDNAVGVRLSVRQETNKAIFDRFLKQARVMYNYPGNTPVWLGTTTPGREARINVTCDVRICGIGKPRMMDRKLECHVRDANKAARLLCSFLLEHDRMFMQRVEADLCQSTVVHAIVRSASTPSPFDEDKTKA